MTVRLPSESYSQKTRELRESDFVRVMGAENLAVPTENLILYEQHGLLKGPVSVPDLRFLAAGTRCDFGVIAKDSLAAHTWDALARGVRCGLVYGERPEFGEALATVTGLAEAALMDGKDKAR